MQIPAGLISESERAAAVAAFAALPPERQAQAVEMMEELARREARRTFFRMYPGQTQAYGDKIFYARHLYPKHLAILAAGKDYAERCFMAANRTGKTFGVGAYETTCHLTGLYPDWWEGVRFPRPTHVWAAGKTSETTRDIVQHELLGPIEGAKASKRPAGTGMIPGDLLGQWSWRQGVSDLVDTIRVRHVSGGWSVLGLKSYEQGRGSFEGTARHFVWLDEEPPADIYGECLVRTATTRGRVLITFTPLEGVSEVVRGFLPQEEV